MDCTRVELSLQLGARDRYADVNKKICDPSDDSGLEHPDSPQNMPEIAKVSLSRFPWTASAFVAFHLQHPPVFIRVLSFVLRHRTL